MPAMLCTICGDTLPDPYTTCRQWCDSVARERGDTLPQKDAEALLVMRGLCQVSGALAIGSVTIEEP
jgi:hypothetical protein